MNKNNNILQDFLHSKYPLDIEYNWKFRKYIYTATIFLSFLIFLLNKNSVGIYGMILSTISFIINFILYKKNSSQISYKYLSSTIDILCLSLYNSIDTFLNSPFVSITSATLLLFPLIIFLSALSFDKRLTLYVTFLSIFSINILYIFACPYFNTNTEKLINNIDIFSQIIRSIFLLISGSIMIFIPRTLNKLIEEHQEFYNNNFDYYKIAHKDMLTGLGNRILLEKYLEQITIKSLNDNLKYAILFLDLDGFKEINDNFGHNIGDEVLKVIANRIRNEVRDSDLVCRLGGDEFIIVAYDIESEENVQILANRILEIVNLPIKTSFTTVKTGISIGISIFPTHSTSWHTLINLADKTMFSVKRTGKNNINLHKKNKL